MLEKASNPGAHGPRQTLLVRLSTPAGPHRDFIAFEAALSADGVTLQVIPSGCHDYLSFRNATLTVRGRDAAENRFILGEGFASLWDGALTVMASEITEAVEGQAS
jgi:hypothetical protein